uniref:Conotoxin superfamily O1 n=1 Tax=Conus magus TaxID=6492 RepID=A0A5P8I0R9_CONMA|nr:conotoxin superfamily O1 [Conus magus]
MKLTYVVIVAVLLLTACQLITADDSRGTQKHRALKSDTKLSMSTRCKGTGKPCSRIAYNCCTGSCRSGKCG